MMGPAGISRTHHALGNHDLAYARMGWDGTACGSISSHSALAKAGSRAGAGAGLDAAGHAASRLRNPPDLVEVRHDLGVLGVVLGDHAFGRGIHRGVSRGGT